MSNVATRRISRTTPRRTTDFSLDYSEQEAAEEFVLPPQDSVPLPSENLEERVMTTQNRLTQLRMEAEALEREKQQFEELSRKQKDFMNGRADVADKLNRGIAALDRDTYEAHKRAEQLQLLRDIYQHHMERVESLTPDLWDPADLEAELNAALGVIDEARGEYEKGQGRVNLLPVIGNVQSLPAPAPAAAPTVAAAMPEPAAPARSIGLPAAGAMNRDTFRYWAFCGLAFTLPLAGIGLLGLIIHAVLR